MKRTGLFLAAMAVWGMCAACGAGEENGLTQVSVQLVKQDVKPGGAPAPMSIPSELDSIVIEIYGPDMESITDRIAVTSDMWDLPYLERYYNVPNGPDRHVSVSAYESEAQSPTYCGFSAQDLTGGIAVFEIVMGDC